MPAAKSRRGKFSPAVHRRWDIASALDTPERVALYLEEAKEDGDPQLTVAAIDDAARATRSNAKRRRTESSKKRRG
jgi:DNA-binding phage protein